jgi:hypothetical protein
MLLASAAPALASSPAANYVVPTKMEYFPDEATATKVLIHGAFFFWQNGGTYNQPACGYMYFACPAGQEAMCRMQWTDIKNGIGGGQCDGFGQQSVVSKATLRVEGTTPANPDSWDLGIGVTPGSFVGGQCAPALALKCPLPAPPADMAGTPPPDLAASPPDLAKSGGTAPHGGCAIAGAQGAAGGTLLLLASALTALVRRRRRG